MRNLSILDMALRSSGMADVWLTEAYDAVSEMTVPGVDNVKIAESSSVMVMAAYLQASAQACIALQLADMVTAADALADRVASLREVLRSDHPLQGETLGGVTNALNSIAESLLQVSAVDGDGFLVAALHDMAKAITDLKDPL